MATKEEVLAGLTDADRAALTDALKSWADSGVENPLIPLDHDIEGDGRLDAWALDSEGKLTIVEVLTVDETVYESDGTGVELGGNGGE